MAAPTIRGSVIPAIVTNGDVSITSPSSTQTDDLLIFFLWTQGTDNTTITHTEKTNFFRWFSHGHDDGTTDGRLTVCVKKATSGGAASYTPWAVANGTANQSSLGMIVLTAGTYQSDLDSVAPRLGTSVTSTNNSAPNCPVVPASGSLTGDFLVLAVSAWHVTTAGSTQGMAGANYTIEIQNANASHVTHLAVKRRALTGLSAATEDPPAWTDNVTPNGTCSQTIAISGYVTNTITASANAVVQSTQTITASADARVDVGVVSPTITASADAVVQSTRTVTASAAAVVQDTRTITASANAVVRGTLTATASANAVVQSTRTVTAVADARVEEGAFSIIASADAVIRDTRAITTSSAAVIQSTRTVTASVDSVVRGTQTITAGSDAAIRTTRSITTTANAYVNEVVAPSIVCYADAHITVYHHVPKGGPKLPWWHRRAWRLTRGA